jgi:hypothetical protein
MVCRRPIQVARQLEAEGLLLRRQLNVGLRRAQPRLWLRNGDRLLLILLTKVWPSLLGDVQIVQPENGPALASCSISSVLAQEVTLHGRAATD